MLQKYVSYCLIGIAFAGSAAASASPAHLSAPVSTHSAKAAHLADKAAAATAAGDKWKALALFRKAATLAPDVARFRSSLGEAYLAVSLYGSAAASFGDALTIDLADSGAQRGWAIAQNGLGRSDVTFADFRPAAITPYRTASAD